MNVFPRAPCFPAWLPCLKENNKSGFSFESHDAPMFGDLDKYILVFLVGLLVTYLLTPMVRQIAIRYGVVDRPDARRPHKRPTARGGGVAVVLGVHAACLAAVLIPWPQM